MESFAREAGDSPLSEARLEIVDDFGPNPGALTMLAYAPRLPRTGAPLVVLLHGCGQSARAFASGSGWLALADRFGFALLCPEQTAANNHGRCFNWFRAKDIAAEGGEAESIRRMALYLIGRERLDRRRVFVVGLSAGGAMALAMLATAPALFAGGAVIAGLAYGAAAGLGEAMLAMALGSRHPPRLLGDQVRRAARGHPGPWPRLSVWQGTADTTVSPANAGQIVAQWLDVLALGPAPARLERHPRHVVSTWRDAAGRSLLELNMIEAMGHGAPVAGAGSADGGRAGPFLIETGIASALHILDFWGLTQRTDATVEPSDPSAPPGPATPSSSPAGPRPTSLAAKLRDLADRALRKVGLRRGA